MMLLPEEAVKLKRAGNRFLVSRKYREAESAFRSLVGQHPDCADGFLGLAKVLARLGDYESIVREIEPEANRLGSNQLNLLLADAYRTLGHRGAVQHVDSAIRLYEKHKMHRKDPVALFYLGGLYREFKKDPERALANFMESWNLDPRSRPAYQGVVACLEQLGRESELERCARIWLDRNPDWLDE